ncbi:hypothetical protein NIES2130_20550 [Scytonema sp. HK-05]|nr:hypothetical protein NIES2130_20550 [Scytonema sp. HK-05]
MSDRILALRFSQSPCAGAGTCAIAKIPVYKRNDWAIALHIFFNRHGVVHRKDELKAASAIARSVRSHAIAYCHMLKAKLANASKF